MTNFKKREWIIFIGLILFAAFAFVACYEKTEKAETTNAVKDETTVDEKNKKPTEMPTPQELGKAYGILFASGMKETEMKIDVNSFKKAFNGVMSSKEEDKEKLKNAEKVVQDAFYIAEQKKVEKSKNENKKFLDENAKKQGIITTESGLQYEVLKEGAGPTITTENVVTMHYTGKLIDGTEFDSSRRPNTESQPFVLDDLTRVIKGWQEGLLLMKKGGVYKLYVPYNLAYGEQGIRGQRGEEIIPPCATLVFDIEIIDITVPEEPNTTEE